MRVLFADKLPDRSRVRLASKGFEVRSEPKLEGDVLAARIAEFDPEVLVVRGTKVTKAHLEAGGSLALVVRAGAGVNTIDLATASERGVFVSNCPGKNAVAVAELAIGLMVALDRRIGDNVADLRSGKWAKGEYSKANGLKGRTLGIIGFGDIGREVAVRARAFGMPVVVWSRSLTPEKAELHGVERVATPEEVAKRADVLSVHLALSGQTRGLVGESVFREIKPGAIFLNTARAEVIDNEALLAAIDAKNLRVGLDVFPEEPSGAEGTYDHPLAKHPRVYGTHHIGASTEEAQEAVAEEMCRIVETYRDSGRVPNCVNLATRSPADHGLIVRHRDRVGVLAAVLGVLRELSINVEEMENTIFEGGKAAIARIQVTGTPSAADLARISSLEHVLHVALVSL
jgi:D-3-phosphoglycerate dehydrogenase